MPMNGENQNNSKDIFILKQFHIQGIHSLLIGMEGSGIIKIKYTEENVEITLWDSVCENIIGQMCFKHKELIK